MFAIFSFVYQARKATRLQGIGQVVTFCMADGCDVIKAALDRILLLSDHSFSPK